MVEILIERHSKNQYKIAIHHEGKMEYFNDDVKREQVVTSILSEAVHRILKRMEV